MSNQYLQQLTEEAAPAYTDVMPITDNGTQRLRKVAVSTLVPTFNVRHYGAAGETDDTTAFQAAIDAAAAVAGGEVLVPPTATGTYIVSQLALKSRVVLRGLGFPIVKQKAGTSGHMIVKNDNTVFWTRITGLILDGNKSNQSASNDLIHYDHTGNAVEFDRIDNCYIRNAKNDGVYLGTQCGAAYLSNLFIYSNDGYGVEIIGPDQLLHDIGVGLSGLDGVYFNSGGQGSRLKNVNSYHSGQIDSTSAAYLLSSVNQVQFSGCFAQDSQGTGAGWEFVGSGYGGHMLSGCCSESVGGPVIKATGMVDSIIDVTIGPGARATSTYALDLSGGSNSRNLFKLAGKSAGWTTDLNGTLGDNSLWFANKSQRLNEVLIPERGFRKNPKRYVYLDEDFVSGQATTGLIGKLGWHFTNGTVSQAGGLANHPGYVTRSTNGTSNYCTMTPSQANVLVPSESFDVTYIVRLNNNDSDTLMRVGFAATHTDNPAADGIYFEKLAADTNWFGVTRASSSQNRTAALVATGTGWVAMRIRRVDGSTIGFTIASTAGGLESATETTATATIPTANLRPFVAIHNAAAGTSTHDIDFFDLLVNGLTR